MAIDWLTLDIPELVAAAEAAGVVFSREPATSAGAPIVCYRVTPPPTPATAAAIWAVESRLSELREFADRYALWAVRLERKGN